MSVKWDNYWLSWYKHYIQCDDEMNMSDQSSMFDPNTFEDSLDDL